MRMNATAKTIGQQIAMFAAVFAAFTLLTAALLWPWMGHLSTELIGPVEDNLQDFWNSWYAAVASDPHHFFYTKLIRYPEGIALNYHSFAYPQIGLFVALTKLFGTDRNTLILLQNLTLLLSFPLAGTGAFYLARHFTKFIPAAFAGGFVFAFNPWHVGQAMHHMHVSWIGFIPFFVLAYLLALERRSVFWLCVAIVFNALTALSCWYFLFYDAYFIIFQTIYLRVRDDEFPKGWRLVAPLACLAGTALLLSPLLLPMLRLSGHSGVYNSGANFFVADPVAYFAFPPTHLLASWTAHLYNQLSGNLWEATVYFGLVNVALLVWLRVRTWREKDPLLVYVFAGIITFCVFASGETLHVFGHDLTWFHLPDIVLSKLPFVANVRTPSRAIVMAYLFLGIGVAHALTRLWEDREGRARVWILAVIIVLMIVDFYPIELRMTDIACRSDLDIIAQDKARDFGVLSLPSGYTESNVYMLQQTCHGRAMVQGNVSRVLSKSLIDRLDTKNLAMQRTQLINAHVKYIVLEHQRHWLFMWPKKDAPQADYAKFYTLAEQTPDLTIFRVY